MHVGVFSIRVQGPYYEKDDGDPLPWSLKSDLKYQTEQARLRGATLPWQWYRERLVVSPLPAISAKMFILLRGRCDYGSPY